MPATHTPVRFSGEEYVRIGSSTRKLKDYPEKERSLWLIFQKEKFEEGIAAIGLSGEEVLKMIDYPSFFELFKMPLPDNRPGIFQRLISENVIKSMT